MPGDLLITLVEYMGVIAITMILSISPALRQKRVVKFVYPRREGVIALVLVAVTAGVLAAAYQLIGPPPAVLAPGKGYDPAQLIRQLSLSFLAAAPFLLALAIRRQPWLSAGLRAGAWRVGLSMGAALALITIFLTGKVYAILGGLSSGEWSYLLAMAGVGLAEEFVFRGYVQLRLMSWLGETWGWLLTAGVYALWRLPGLLLSGAVTAAQLPLQLGLLLVFALLLGWIMRKSGNILGPAIYHAVHEWVRVL